MSIDENLAQALQGLLNDITEYQTKNHLGRENNHWQVEARKTLSKYGSTKSTSALTKNTTSATEQPDECPACDGEGRIETENNGPIVPCWRCQPRENLFSPEIAENAGLIIAVANTIERELKGSDDNYCVAAIETIKFIRSATKRESSHHVANIGKMVDELYTAIFYSGSAPTYKNNCRGFRAHGKEAIEKFLSTHFDAEIPERCESGCNDPVVAHDIDGVPLCQGCYDMLKAVATTEIEGGQS